MRLWPVEIFILAVAGVVFVYWLESNEKPNKETVKQIVNVTVTSPQTTIAQLAQNNVVAPPSKKETVHQIVSEPEGAPEYVFDELGDKCVREAYERLVANVRKNGAIDYLAATEPIMDLVLLISATGHMCRVGHILEDSQSFLLSLHKQMKIVKHRGKVSSMTLEEIFSLAKSRMAALNRMVG